jgi:hypothetical protein
MKQDSPFNWQGKPSIFTVSHDFNGVNTAKSLQATSADKAALVLKNQPPWHMALSVNKGKK